MSRYERSFDLWKQAAVCLAATVWLALRHPPDAWSLAAAAVSCLFGAAFALTRGWISWLSLSAAFAIALGTLFSNTHGPVCLLAPLLGDAIGRLFAFYGFASQISARDPGEE
jgi:hypothetical protein